MTPEQARHLRANGRWVVAIALVTLVVVLALEARGGRWGAVASGNPVLVGFSLVLLGLGSWVSPARTGLGCALTGSSVALTALALVRLS